MGMNSMLLSGLQFILLIGLCTADCTSLFLGQTDIYINDSTTYEQGDLIGDYTDELGNHSLSFLGGDCDTTLEIINGTKLVLRVNLLSQDVCDILSVSCQWKCIGSSLKHTLRLHINRESREKLRFKKPSYSKNVSESTHTGTTVFSFDKSDIVREDCIDLTNAFFSIGGNNLNYFYMRPQSSTEGNIYNIILNTTLDYDQPNNHYQLNISAMSKGIQNFTTLVIQVTDVDDMDPVFDHDIYTLHIPEENTTIQNNSLKTSPPINATDRDQGQGRQPVFYRFEDNKNSRGCFTIDKITGEISTTCRLDRETNSTYTLTIKAVQQNTDVRSCTATLSIIVDDINDHIPVFLKTEFNATVAEHSNIGTPITQVTAIDKDVGVNAEVGYMIIPPESHTFSVDNNGIIRVQNPKNMDREIGDGTIKMKVYAFDKESGKNSTSTATVHITLLDVNDNAPLFEKKEYTFSLPLEPKNGDIVGSVKAFDSDQANTPNTEIRYRLEQSLSSNMFSINNRTGEIAFKKVPPLTTNLIELAAVAFDQGNPPLSSYAQILLTRTHVVGHSVRFTVPESKEELEKRKSEIQEKIGKILGLSLRINKIEASGGNSISCYLNATAKLLNGSDVSGQILQSLVLQHMSEILALFSNGEAAKLVHSEDKFPPVVIALIAICGVMFIGTIILIGFIYHTTRRFDRYKRLNDHLTRRSSLYESQEMKIQMTDEQTSDYNGSLNGSHDLSSLHNGTTGELKEGVVSAFTNPVYNVDDETTVKLDPAEEEAQQTLNDLADHLDAEDTNILPVDSYNPSESDIEVEIRPDYDAPNDYVNVPLQFGENSAPDDENVPNSSKSLDVPEDYPNDKKDLDSIKDEDNSNEQNEDEDEPNPDYEVKAVRFSTQVLDTDENKFEPLKEKDDVKKDEESGEDIDDKEEDIDMQEDDEEDGNCLEGIEQGKEDDFGDGIEIERTDEEILSPNETLRDDHDSEEDNTPHFAFDTKM